MRLVTGRCVTALEGRSGCGRLDLLRVSRAEGHPLRKDFPLRGRFSREEQTRRALNQDVERFYLAEDLGAGDPQEVEAAAAAPALESGDAATGDENQGAGA